VRTEEASLDQSFRDTLTQLEMEIGVVENAYQTATPEETTEYLKSLQSKGEELTRALENLSSEEEKAIARPLVNESIEKSKTLQSEMVVTIQPLLLDLEELIDRATTATRDYTEARKAELQQYIGDIDTAWNDIEHFYTNDLNEYEQKAVKPEVDDIKIRKSDIEDEMRQLIDV